MDPNADFVKGKMVANPCYPLVQHTCNNNVLVPKTSWTPLVLGRVKMVRSSMELRGWVCVFGITLALLFSAHADFWENVKMLWKRKLLRFGKGFQWICSGGVYPLMLNQTI